MTDLQEIEQLVEQYRSWLKDKTTLKSVHKDWVEISTPFLDRHNDHILLYVRTIAPGKFQITDDGQTLQDLELSGCKLDTPKRQSLLKVALNGFRVDEVGGALNVQAASENFAARKHALIQAILAINDMFYLATSTVQSLFKEDVEAWLKLSGVRFLANVQFTGKSGYVHNFDFAIPSSPSAPERVIRAISNPSKDAALNFVTAWIETADQRPNESRAIAFLNDSLRGVGTSVVDALKQYEIEPIVWSEREAHRQSLAA